jgi:hypothetical protein
LEEELRRSELRTINTTIASRKDIFNNRMRNGRRRGRTTSEIVVHNQIPLFVHSERTMRIRGSEKKLSVGNHSSGRDSEITGNDLKRKENNKKKSGRRDKTNRMIETSSGAILTL